MFNQKYEDRLHSWNCLRQSLETSKDPYKEVIEFYRMAPQVSIATDPWDKSMWPTPWELIFENQYDEFCSVLGKCYSLQLTDRFSGSIFEIHIGIDREQSRTCYLLIIDKSIVIGWSDSYEDIKIIPNSFHTQKIFTMPKLQ